MDYKNHMIDVSIRSNIKDSGWIPDVFVIYREHGKNVLKSLPIDHTFATPAEAEQAGIECAKKWIDDGKPEFDLVVRIDRIECKGAKHPQEV
jgi:hypothetical protein